MVITQNHIINIQPGVSAPLVIHCSQGDTGTQINLTVVNGDEEFDCSSYACSVHGVRSDGGNWGPITCTVSGSTVCFSLTSAMTAVAGACLAEISVGTVGTANFAMLMENATFENGVTYSNDVSVYQNILNAVQAGLSLAEAAVTNEKDERIAAVTNEKNERIEAVNAEATARQSADNTLQGNINSEASTRASADSNLQSQINQIIAPSGEAPSAAEVQNARIGADGVTYGTLGAAIRNQFDNINSGNLAFASKIGNNTLPVKILQRTSSNPYNGVQIYSNKSGAIRIKGTTSAQILGFALTENFTANAFDVYVKVTGYASAGIMFGLYDGTSTYGELNVGASNDINYGGTIHATESNSVYVYLFIPTSCTLDVTVLLSNDLYLGNLVYPPQGKIINKCTVSRNAHHLLVTGGDEDLLIDLGIDYDRLCCMPYISGGLRDKIDFNAGTINFSGLTVITQNHYYSLPNVTITYPVNNFVQHFIYDYDANEIRVYEGAYTGRYICLFSIYYHKLISPFAYLYEKNMLSKEFTIKGEVAANSIHIDSTEGTITISDAKILIGNSYVDLGSTYTKELSFDHIYANYYYYNGTGIDVTAENSNSGIMLGKQPNKIPLFYVWGGKVFGLSDYVKVYLDGVLIHGMDGLDDGLQAQKMAFLGDSITEGVGAGGNNGSYPRWIADKLRCVTVNCGLSGSAVTVKSGQSVRGFIERVADIPTDCTVVAFMGGTNDYWQNVPLGQDGDTTSSTFYGALAVLCESLQTRFPKAFIYAVAPPMGWQPNNNFDMSAKTNIGSFEDVNNAIKTVCRKYAIPVLDMMHDSSLNPKVDATKNEYFSDGVHLNANGEKCLASMHIGFLRSHYRMTW